MPIGKVGNFGYKTFNPSTADKIDIGGVINPSAISAEQPKNAATKGHLNFCSFTKAYKAKMPPSP